MAKRKPKPPQEGDLVIVRWVDISGGESDKPDPPLLETPGYYVGWETHNGERGLRTARHVVVAGHGYDRGNDFYPKGVVRNVEVIQRG